MQILDSDLNETPIFAALLAERPSTRTFLESDTIFQRTSSGRILTGAFVREVAQSPAEEEPPTEVSIEPTGEAEEPELIQVRPLPQRPVESGVSNWFRASAS